MCLCLCICLCLPVLQRISLSPWRSALKILRWAINVLIWQLPFLILFSTMFSLIFWHQYHVIWYFWATLFSTMVGSGVGRPPTPFYSLYKCWTRFSSFSGAPPGVVHPQRGSCPPSQCGQRQRCCCRPSTPHSTWQSGQEYPHEGLAHLRLQAPHPKQCTMCTF